MESSSLSIGSGLEITSGLSTFVQVKVKGGLFGYGAEASGRLDFSTEASQGYDFRYDITDTSFLTSSLIRNNADHIGPGKGDIYWGELWLIRWELNATHIKYFNNSEHWVEPVFYYGVLRDVQSIVGDDLADDTWKSQNPVYNGYSGVHWLDTVVAQNGGKLVSEHTVSSTTTRTNTFNWEISASAEAKLKSPGIEVSAGFSVSFGMGTYAEESLGHSITAGYEIHDNEGEDIITADVGIDKQFGTYVFRTKYQYSQTSNPLEYNTRDYVPPALDFPSIDYDYPNYDGIHPCENDNPRITVKIDDESGIQENGAYIFYSINDGANWNTAVLFEQEENAGFWSTYIPGQEHGTDVIWYVNVTDISGYSTVRTDPFGDYYAYSVKNRNPMVSLITPVGGESFADQVLISWEGTDPDEDTIYYILEYNIENTGWQLLDSRINITSYVWNTTSIHNSNAVLIRIIVMDDYGGIGSDTISWVFSIHVPTGLDPLTNGMIIGGIIGAVVAGTGVAIPAVLKIKKKQR